MKKLIILLLLISLSGCTSSLVKDEKTSQEIEFTKKLQDEVAINLDRAALWREWEEEIRKRGKERRGEKGCILRTPIRPREERRK